MTGRFNSGGYIFGVFVRWLTTTTEFALFSSVSHWHFFVLSLFSHLHGFSIPFLLFDATSAFCMPVYEHSGVRIVALVSRPSLPSTILGLSQDPHTLTNFASHLVTVVKERSTTLYILHCLHELPHARCFSLVCKLTDVPA